MLFLTKLPGHGILHSGHISGCFTCVKGVDICVSDQAAVSFFADTSFQRELTTPSLLISVCISTDILQLKLAY